MFAVYLFSYAELYLVPGLVCLAILLFAGRKLLSTTLLAPIFWCGLSVVGAGSAFRYVYGSQADGVYYRYLAAVLLIAPTLALLGAKRPQNGAWQFIVLTLVGVLLLPVMQGWLFGDQQPHVHLLFRWVIVTHILIGVVNYLPTRYAAPALFFGATQTLISAEYFPFALPQVARLWPITLWCLCASLIWASVAARRTRLTPGLDRLWLDFRDAYGLVWGLRIAERLNASAQKHGWPVEFTWGGMIVREGAELDAETRHRVEREMRSHLRRFVSHDWIAARLPDSPSARPLTGARGSE